VCLSIGGASGVCSHGCNPANGNAECPSGYACLGIAGGGAACVAAPSCSAVLQAFGSLCIDDSFCAGAGLQDAQCVDLLKSGKTVLSPGYCSSRCETDADCPTVGTVVYRCGDTVKGKACVKT
jgi:hypothetical protein